MPAAMGPSRWLRFAHRREARGLPGKQQLLQLPRRAAGGRKCRYQQKAEDEDPARSRRHGPLGTVSGDRYCEDAARWEGEITRAVELVNADWTGWKPAGPMA